MNWSNGIDIMKDPVSGAAAVVELEHTKTHAGQTFLIRARRTLTNDEPVYRLIKTGNKVIHFKQVNITSEKQDFNLDVWESPDVDSETPGTLVNNLIPYNRISSQDPEIVMYIEPNFTNPSDPDLGEQIDEYYVPGGDAPGGAIGGSAGSSWEHVLKKNTCYLIRGYRRSGSTGSCDVLVKYKIYIGGGI